MGKGLGTPLVAYSPPLASEDPSPLPTSQKRIRVTPAEAGGTPASATYPLPTSARSPPRARSWGNPSWQAGGGLLAEVSPS